jgi:hypothetical protein
MKLTVAYRDKPAGGFSGAKNHFVAFHVEFSNEERAIIQERGLYDQSVSVPSDTPPPTRSGDFLAMLMRIVGIILAPLGALFALVASLKPQEAGAGGPGWTMLIAGIILFTIGKIKDRQAYKREASPDQKLTYRRLLTTPDFVVYAGSLLEAQGYEAYVRESLSEVAQSIRQSVAVREQASYEL